MKKLTVLVAAVALIAATGGMAVANTYTYADQVISLNPTPMGAPNHASNMNMNWAGIPADSADPDRLLGAHDQNAVGWGPGGQWHSLLL